MRNMFVGLLCCLLAFVLTSCGGSSTDTTNNFGVETPQPTTITVTTADQFGNPVDGRIVFNGDLLGLKEAQVTFDPAQGGILAFDALPGYAPPAPLDLSVTHFEMGEFYRATYIRDGSVAQVCPRAINGEGVLIDAQLSVNGIPVDYLAGYCQSVNTCFVAESSLHFQLLDLRRMR